MITHETLAVQSGDAGFYAEVAIRLDIQDGNEEFSVAYRDGITADWKLAAGFGLAYAREHLPQHYHVGKRLLVEVIDVRGHLVDTTLMGVAFVAARVLWKALAYDGPAGFELDAAARIFRVPR